MFCRKTIMKNILLEKLVFLVFVLSLAACGGGDDGISGTGQDDPGPDVKKYTVSGAAQKGPFIIGSSVEINFLESNGQPSSQTIPTKTIDDLGNFNFELSSPQLVNIKAEGYHFNELTGSLSLGPLTLNAIFDAQVIDGQVAYVNVLTHLIHQRVVKLIKEGNNAGDAITQAETELVKALLDVLPVDALPNFTTLNVYDTDKSNTEGNAYLLALSAIVYQLATIKADESEGDTLDAELSKLLNTTADAFKDKGEIANPTLISELKIASRMLIPSQIEENLKLRSFVVISERLDVPDINIYLDTDGDGETNINDDDDDGDGFPDVADDEPYVVGKVSTQIILSDGVVVEGNKTLRLLVSDIDLVEQVEFFIDAESVGTVNAAPFKYEWNPYYFSDEIGNVTLSTLVTDIGGNASFGPSEVLEIIQSSNQSLQLDLVDSAVIRDENEVNLTWSGLDDAQKYQVQVWKTANPDSLIIDEEIALTEMLIQSLDKGEYQWRVQAANQFNNWGAWAEAKTFIIAGPNSPLLTLPKNFGDITNTNRPLLRWNDSEYAEDYLLEVSAESNFSNVIAQESIDITEYQVDALLEGEYYWRVAAVNAADIAGNYSETRSFSVTGPQAPQIVFPTQNAVVRDTVSPNLSWETSESATAFTLELASDSGFQSTIEKVETDQASFETTSLAVGDYYWRIRAKNELGFLGDWSEVYSFSISGPQSPVVLPATSGGIPNIGVTLHWNAVNGEVYDIQISDDEEYSEVREYSNIDTDSLLITDYKRGVSWWRIRAINALGVKGEWSQVYQFETERAPWPDKDSFTLISNDISMDTAWDVGKSPYFVMGTVRVFDSVELKIEPGVVVLFDGAASLVGHGEIIANGSLGNKITFTSAFGRKYPGDWDGLHYFGKATKLDSENNYIDGSALLYSNVEYAGYYPNHAAVNIFVEGLLVSDSIIARNANSGIKVGDSGSGDYAQIINNIIEENGKCHVDDALYNQTWGAIDMKSMPNNSFTNISNNLIRNNSNPSGFGVISIDSWNGNVTFSRNIFSNNCGRALHLRTHSSGKISVSNNVFYNNYVKTGNIDGSIIIDGHGADYTQNLVYNKNLTSQATKDSPPIFEFKTLPERFQNNNINVPYLGNLIKSPFNQYVLAPNNWWGSTDQSLLSELGNEYSGTQYWPFLATPFTNAPISLPINVQLTETNSTTFELSWDENIESDISGYRVYLDADGQWPYDEIIDVGTSLMHSLENIDLSSTKLIGVSAYDTSYVESNDNPQTEINENQIAGNESLISKVNIN